MLNPFDLNTPNQLHDMPAIPLAGNPIIIAAPANRRSELIYIEFQLQTDATVASRNARLVLHSGARTIDLAVPTIAIAANLTVTYRFGIHLEAYATTLSNFLTAPLVPTVFAFEGDTWQIDVDNIQAGDQLGPTTYVANTWPMLQ